mgnify:CR=1 FL=1
MHSYVQIEENNRMSTLVNGTAPRKLIQFKNIVKEFDGQIVLKGINLDIYENEFVTLPIPLAPPVTMTTLSLNINILFFYIINIIRPSAFVKVSGWRQITAYT